MHPTPRDANVARSGFYRLLSAAFLYPNAELWDFLRTGVPAARELLADLPAENRADLEFLLQAWDRSLRALTLDDLEAEYIRTFTHVTPVEYPPYETQYGHTQVFYQSQQLADIAGFYRAFGLDVSTGAKERLDHISVELEFMAFLAYKEAYARAHDGDAAGEICRRAQQSFMTHHLGRFGPLFARRLRQKAGDGYYGAPAELLERFLEAEFAYLGVRPLVFEASDIVTPDWLPEGAGFTGLEAE
ncbi:Selenate reductase assembly chaperone protein [bacterium HR11]|nr:Selenate reductase assembly chaperone protein [bacterium HR11]